MDAKRLQRLESTARLIREALPRYTVTIRHGEVRVALPEPFDPPTFAQLTARQRSGAGS